MCSRRRRALLLRAQDILAAINSGQLLVNYAGHGSEEQWSGTDLFDNSTASSLTNGSSLPVFLIMDCLNGFFQDVYEEPLAVTLMLAPNGGAVAVLASSGLNQAPPQTNLDKLVVQNAFNSPPLALGDAILKGKSGITDLGVRKTFILFGDPSMQIKMPGASPSTLEQTESVSLCADHVLRHGGSAQRLRNCLHHSLEACKIERLRPVGKRSLRAGMYFDNQPIRSHGDCGARDCGNQALLAGAV